MSCSRALIVAAVAVGSSLSGISSAELPPHYVVATFGPTEDELFPSGVFLPPQAVEFGRGVAARDNYALAGMPAIDKGHGRVAVFTRNASNVWQRTGTLAANDAALVTGFGRSIAFRRNIAVIGAHEAAYVFRRDNTTWKQILKLKPPSQDGFTAFGTAVQYQDGIVVVGAPFWNSRGAAYVFHIDTSKGTVLRRQRLSHTDAETGAGFGSSVSMTHDTIIIGAPGLLGIAGAQPSPGAAYVFRLSNSIWSQRQKLIAIDGENYDRFGEAVAIDRGMIIVGAPLHDRIGDYFGDPVSYYAGGAAYVFVPVAGRYAEQGQLRPRLEDHSGFIDFGSTVAMFDQYIVVGAATSDYVGVAYNPPGLGFSYIRSGNTLTARGIAYRGVKSTAISIANNWLLMGSPFEDRCPSSGCIGEAVLFNLNRLQ